MSHACDDGLEKGDEVVLAGGDGISDWDKGVRCRV